MNRFLSMSALDTIRSISKNVSRKLTRCSEYILFSRTDVFTLSVGMCRVILSVPGPVSGY